MIFVCSHCQAYKVKLFLNSNQPRGREVLQDMTCSGHIQNLLDIHLPQEEIP
jgi:hypothetical protein